jgi:hypothetical protein
MPLSTDPVRRAKQLENLRPAGAVSHGAMSEGKLKPLRAEHRAALLRRFPQLDEHRLWLLSDLLARIDLVSEFVDVHGLMRNTCQTYPVLELLTRWERRAWDMLSQLAAKDPGPRERDRDTSMLQIELTADEQIGSWPPTARRARRSRIASWCGCRPSVSVAGPRRLGIPR